MKNLVIPNRQPWGSLADLQTVDLLSELGNVCHRVVQLLDIYKNKTPKRVLDAFHNILLSLFSDAATKETANTMKFDFGRIDMVPFITLYPDLIEHFAHFEPTFISRLPENMITPELITAALNRILFKAQSVSWDNDYGFSDYINSVIWLMKGVPASMFTQEHWDTFVANLKRIHNRFSDKNMMGGWREEVLRKSISSCFRGIEASLLPQTQKSNCYAIFTHDRLEDLLAEFTDPNASMVQKY